MDGHLGYSKRAPEGRNSGNSRNGHRARTVLSEAGPRLARRLVPELPGYKLGDLVARFQLAEGLPDGLKPHRATYDALVTARLFAVLADRADSLEELRGQPPEKVDEDALF